jgi:hypothetical protein
MLASSASREGNVGTIAAESHLTFRESTPGSLKAQRQRLTTRRAMQTRVAEKFTHVHQKLR